MTLLIPQHSLDVSSRRFVVEERRHNFAIRDLVSDEIIGFELSRFLAETYAEFREDLADRERRQ